MASASDKMSQDAIDALLASMNLDIEDKEFEKIEYHLMICRYCRHIYSSRDLGTHYLLTKSKCKGSEFGHAYMSEELLNDKKVNNIFGWQRTYNIKSKPRSRNALKINNPADKK